MFFVFVVRFLFSPRFLFVYFSFVSFGVVIEPYYSRRIASHRLSDQKSRRSWLPTAIGGGGGGSNRERNLVRDEEVRRIRLRQQEEHDRRAKEAAAARQEEAASEKPAAPEEEKKKPKKKKVPVSARTKPTGGYNALQPWSASQGGGYRYAKMHGT